MLLSKVNLFIATNILGVSPSSKKYIFSIILFYFFVALLLFLLVLTFLDSSPQISSNRQLPAENSSSSTEVLKLSENDLLLKNFFDVYKDQVDSEPDLINIMKVFSNRGFLENSINLYKKEEDFLNKSLNSLQLELESLNKETNIRLIFLKDSIKKLEIDTCKDASCKKMLKDYQDEYLELNLQKEKDSLRYEFTKEFIKTKKNLLIKKLKNTLIKYNFMKNKNKNEQLNQSK